jgi:GTPase
VELDELLDSLNLVDSAPRIKLRDLVLGSDDNTLRKLGDVIVERIEEGAGETVFDLGFENSGESMQLTLEEWNQAYTRLVEAAKRVGADCQLLLTTNVGGKEEAESTTTSPPKDKSCSGKILIRRIPGKIEDVIETRIAVVGNGKLEIVLSCLFILDNGSANILCEHKQSMLERVRCLVC